MSEPIGLTTRAPRGSWGRCRLSRAATAIVLASATACRDEPSGIDVVVPTISASAIAPGMHNVLSATVTVGVQDADSVRVRFRLADATGVDIDTPVSLIANGSATVPLLGLFPERRYIARAIAYGGRQAAEGELLELTTGALPADIPRYVAMGVDPSPGFLVFATARYAVAIDNSGRVVWYRHFPDGVGLSFMAQPSGSYVTRPPTPLPGDIEPWVEVNRLGVLQRTMHCARGLVSRPHDLLLAPDGSYYILCDETRTMDLTAIGGVAAARVVGTVVQRISASGALLFEWTPFDHFAITDVALAERTGANVNWTHGNAIELDGEGNLLVSFRNLGEITRIDARTGAVIWRMGGLRNEFTFNGLSGPPFTRQHSVRSKASSAIVLLDNLGDPLESRAEHYAIDEAARTVTLVQSYGSVPRVVTEIGGSVQSLPGDRTLVSFGTAGRVEEYDATGRLVWRIQGNPGYVFRAQRIHSLYTPGVGSTR